MKNKKLFSTDALAKRVWKSLVRDFRSIEGSQFCSDQEHALDSHIREYRSVSWPGKFGYDASKFKRQYQLENLFKRYRFEDDVYSEQELQDITNAKLVDTQMRIGMPRERWTYRSFLVLQRARKIIAEVLGDYDPEEHRSLCSFGKRASVGHPYSKSCLHEKLHGQLTGSHEHVEWFNDYLQTDHHLVSAISERTSVPIDGTCDSLTLTNVPKSFKALRSIMPNTLIGGFYTYGLGEVISARLRKIGLDISRLQLKHGVLARKFSKSRTHATVDMSAASDSFTYEVVNALIPRKWVKALKLGRITTVNVAGSSQKLVSFMTMGIGFTFPLQTLMFYSLAKATKELLGIHGLISVYGDDIIYPVEMHNQMTAIFTDLRFHLNQEKTYVNEYFRESCGSDYYYGFDVRPFNPEGGHQLLTGRGYVSVLYKTINGLLRRWDEAEIAITLRFLYSEILRVDDQIFQVPKSFPDYSGVKLEKPVHNKKTLFPWSHLSWNPKLHCISFPYWGLAVRRKSVALRDHSSYYWNELRTASAVRLLSVGYGPPSGIKNPFEKVQDSTALIWRKVKPKSFVRAFADGKRLRRLEATVAEKVDPCVVCQTGSTSCWSDDI
jgi:hypothetical protein